MKAQRSINTCLLGASLDTGNLGVSALASGTINSLLHTFPEAEVALFDYRRSPSSHQVHLEAGRQVAVPLVNVRFSWKFWLSNNIALLLLLSWVSRAIPHRRWRQALLGSNSSLRRLLTADFVASIGGGDSFSDIYGLGRFFYVTLPQLLVIQVGVPLVLLPQTYGPFKGRIARGIAGYIVKRSAAVYSRDQAGITELDRLYPGLTHPPQFAYDMAFALEPAKAAQQPALRLNPDEVLVGLNVSGLLFMGGYTRDNMFGLSVDYPRLMEEIVDLLLRQPGTRVVLVSHVLGDDVESDTTACRRLWEKLQPKYGERLSVLGGHYNQHEVKYLIGQFDFFLGARMHACIAALSQCVPVVPLAYSGKFIGVMDSVGCAELVLDLRKVDNAEAIAAIHRLFIDRNRIKVSLNEHIPQVRSRVLGLFDTELFRKLAALKEL